MHIKISLFFKKSACALIRAYQYTLSPDHGIFGAHLAGAGAGCRFLPTCSEYALQSIQLHGVRKGAGLAIKRVIRCRPGGGSGYDPARI